MPVLILRKSWVSFDSKDINKVSLSEVNFYLPASNDSCEVQLLKHATYIMCTAYSVLVELYKRLFCEMYRVSWKTALFRYLAAHSGTRKKVIGTCQNMAHGAVCTDIWIHGDVRIFWKVCWGTVCWKTERSGGDSNENDKYDTVHADDLSDTRMEVYARVKSTVRMEWDAFLLLFRMNSKCHQFF